MRIHPSQLSKQVARLEEELGVRLFTRSTRSVKLTPEGQEVLPRVSSLLEDIEGLEASFQQEKSLRGTIRLTAVPFLARRFLLEAMAQFRATHSKVEFELDLSEGLRNLVDDQFDLALRIHAEPSDSSLVYRQLLPNQLIFCASPSYLKRAGAPRRLTDLEHHQVLMLDVHRRCQLKETGARLGDYVRPAALRCNDGAFLTEAALAGEGILLRSLWDVQEHLESGSLIQVLKAHPLAPFGHIYAVLPGRRLLTPRVRAFVDHLTQAMGAKQ